jgi:large subunit ribosomal protein L4e
VYGTFETPSAKKKGFVLPRPKMANADLSRLINSDEVQSVVKPINKVVKRREPRKNPLKNMAAVLKLNPYLGTARKMAALAEAARVKARKEKLDSKRTKLSPVRSSVHVFSFSLYLYSFLAFHTMLHLLYIISVALF